MRVKKYLDTAKKEGVVLTIQGLAIALDVTSKQLEDWSVKGSIKERDIIQKAKEFIANDLYIKGVTGKVNNVMAIFGLKAQHKWAENHNLMHTNKDGKPLKIKLCK